MQVPVVGRGWSWRTRWTVVIFAFPVLCAIAAAAFALETLLFLSRAERATGTVVERYDRPGETIFDRGRINYEPIFAYEAHDGPRRASVGSGHTSFGLEIGETAPILYDPATRANVRMDSWQGLWFIPVAVAGFGLASLILAVPAWLIARRCTA